MDVSADLTELGRTPVTVVCAGAKSILDIPRTLEFLETQVILPGAGQCWGLPEHSWGIKAAACGVLVVMLSVGFSLCVASFTSSRSLIRIVLITHTPRRPPI